MSDIPSDIYRKILLKLPAEPLFRFRSVCKAWRRIIDDPSFIRSHTNNQHSSTTLLIRTCTGSPIYSLSLDSINYTEGKHVIDVTRVKTLMQRDVPRLPLLPVASCNGLILISHRDINKIWVIWNPLTREFHELPEPVSHILLGSGLGYDYAADDYKVVRIDEARRFPGQTVYETRVYSLKWGYWKMIKDCPCEIPWNEQGVFLNGALHWRTYDEIIALDLGSEDYRQLPLPPIPKYTFGVNLDVLGESLVLSYHCSESSGGWVMKNYGVENSWMMLYSGVDIIGSGRDLRPVAYFKNKGQVLLHDKIKFFLLDIEGNFVKKFSIDDIINPFTCQICPGSLFRLDDSCDVSGYAAEKITAGGKRKRRKNDRRLKFSVSIGNILHCWDSDCGSDSGWLDD